MANTTLSKALELTDARAGYDVACKRLLSEKVILARLLQLYLDEFRDYDVKEIEKCVERTPLISIEPVMQDETSPLISGMDTVDKALNEGTVYYDILFKAIVLDTQKTIIINIEAQNDYYPGYPLLMRGNYYASRLLTSQRGREFIGSNYGEIKKVYTIWICLNPSKEKENAINSIHQVVRPIVGHAKEKEEEYALMTLIMVYLGDPKDTENNLLKLLDVLFSNKIRVNEKKK